MRKLIGLFCVLVIALIPGWVRGAPLNCQILYSAEDEACRTSAGISARVAIYDPSNKQVQPVVDTCGTHTFLLSPTHQYLAVDNRRVSPISTQVFRRDESGKAFKLIDALAEKTPSGWSPKGHYLMLSGVHKQFIYRYIYDTTTGSFVPFPTVGFSAEDVQFSFDEQYIALWADVWNEDKGWWDDNPQLFIVNPGADNPRQISDATYKVQHFAWLPSNDLAYLQCSGAGCQLKITDVTGAVKQTINEPLYAAYPSGQNPRLIFGANDGSRYPLFIFDPSTQTRVTIDEMRQFLFVAEWSPDGQKIQYLKPTGKEDLVSLFMYDVQRQRSVPVYINLGNQFSNLGDWDSGSSELLIADETSISVYDVASNRLSKIDVPIPAGTQSSVEAKWLCQRQQHVI